MTTRPFVHSIVLTAIREEHTGIPLGATAQRRFGRVTFLTRLHVPRYRPGGGRLSPVLLRRRQWLGRGLLRGPDRVRGVPRVVRADQELRRARAAPRSARAHRLLRARHAGTEDGALHARVPLRATQRRTLVTGRR